MKVFHIDCGRKYFTAKEIKDILAIMSKKNYDMIELAFGNDGMRFFLDDMSVATGAENYESESVKSAIDFGNKSFCDSRENALTEAEMEDIIATAKDFGIEVLPLLNTPGHMDAIVMGMEKLGIKDVRFKGSVTTMDFDNEEAMDFTKALISKYVAWFAQRGCTIFNMGCDEYANDVLASGFDVLCNPDKFLYDKFISYVNSIADIVLAHGMTPVMFNDGMYYGKNLDGGKLNPEIICSYWTTGWPGYTPAPADFVAEQGHKILNTHNIWYYVLGRRTDAKPNSMFNNEDAKNGISSVGHETVVGGFKGEAIGSMFCLWCDEPYVEYSSEEVEIVNELITLF